VVIYGVRYFDRDFYFQSGALGTGGAGTLKKLSRETGGAMFEVSKKHSLKDIFEEIQAELRSQYSIGYTPKGDPTSSGFRRIKLETRHKDYKVQSRNGYYPKSS
jgi:VWFA-related protein